MGYDSQRVNEFGTKVVVESWSRLSLCPGTMLKGHLRTLDRSRNSHTKEVAQPDRHSTLCFTKASGARKEHLTEHVSRHSVELVMKGCWHYVNNRFL